MNETASGHEKPRSEIVKNIAITISSLATAIAIPLIGYFFSSALKERETQGKFVELAVTILREDPIPSRLNLRKWATQVMNTYSGVKLDAETVQDLIKKEAIPDVSGPESRPRDAKILELLEPEAAKLAAQLIQEAGKRGIDARLISGYRSIAEQEELFAQGRTKPGRIITAARRSNHNTGLAFDVGIFKNGRYVSDDEASEYTTVGEIGRSIGLIWGGDWKPVQDAPHFQTKDAEELLARLKAEMPARVPGEQVSPTP